MNRAQSANASAQGADRRKFFRVEDRVVLHYRVLPKDKAAHCKEKLDAQQSDRFTMAAGFTAKTVEMRPLLNSIETKTPEVASYLRELDQKLNCIAQMFMLQELGLTEEYGREVSLSAGGVAFESDKPITADSLVEFRLLLLSSSLGLTTIGKVVRCAQRPDGSYEIAAEFLEIREQDRDLLVSHLLGKQAELRRAELLADNT